MRAQRRRTVFKNDEIPGLIHQMRPFLSEGKLPDGTRRWSAYGSPVLGYGHLPAQYRDGVAAAVYVVYSYDTPVAWVLERDQTAGDPYFYVVPDVSYSPTTGQHQYACREAWEAALRQQGTYRRFGARGREVVRVPGNAEVYGREIRARAGGMDGVRPGERIGEGRYDDSPRSAYEGVPDDAMHYSPGYDGSPRRAHP